MKKQILQMASVLLGTMVVSSAFAQNQLSCEQLLNTHWVDTTDFQFGQISVKYYWMDTDPFALDYDLNYYGGSFGDDGQTQNCTVQPDGSVVLIMNLDSDFGYLALQTNDMITFKVLPGSHLLNNNDKQIPVAGPFVRG